MEHYSTLTGRQFDLSSLSKAERSFLAEVMVFYRQDPDWSQFSTFWIQKGERELFAGQERRQVTKGTVWHICQDLEIRLGVRQGQVAFPSWRDRLAELIEERYGSRYKFCQATGVDQGFLSKVLSGQKDFSLATLSSLLAHMGMTLQITDPKTALEQQEQALVQIGL